MLAEVSSTDIQIQILPDQEAVETLLAFKKPRVVRPPVTLPFGFKPSRRRGRRPSQPVARRSGVVAASSLGAEEALMSEQVASSESQEEGSHETTSSSESCSSTDSGESPASESGPEVPEAIATELEGQDTVLHELQQEQSLASVPATTFFNAHVGIIDVSFGPTRGKAASCFHCTHVIEKGAARFSYSYNVRRPWRYVHSDCLVPFLAALKSERALEQSFFLLNSI